MSAEIDHDIFDDALKRCGANWDAAQSHGALSGRLAVTGAAGMQDIVATVLDGTDTSNALRRECESMLETLYQRTHRQLSERLSDFSPLLPDDEDPAARRTEAIAHWSEGYLHGLVSSGHDDALKSRLAAEPIADIIKDLLEITRAVVGEDDEDEESEAAYAEIVEYLRVAAQLVYEELADLRPERVQ